MSYDKAEQARRMIIGTKQTTKAVTNGVAVEVLVARDADPGITTKVVNLCKHNGVKVTYIDSMKSLGRACGIEVGAAVAAVISE